MFRRTARAAALAREEDGAIMVLGAFLALFLVGLLYFAVGLGKGLVAREQMQDAADAAAFSSAVAAARGMNLIVVANQINSSALAISVALEVVDGVAQDAINQLTPGDPDIAMLQAVRTEVAAQNLTDQMRDVMRTASRAAGALRNGTLAVARDGATQRVRMTYRPRAIAVHTPASLPTAEVPADTTNCNEAGAFANLIGTTPFYQYPNLSQYTQNFISFEIAQRTAQTATTSATYCPVPADQRTQSVTAALGTEAYQIRAFVVGAADLRAEDKGVRAANRFQNQMLDLGVIDTELRRMAGVAVAQAEFYLAGAGSQPTTALAWDQRWQARLRRVTLPPTVTNGALLNDCASVPGNDGCGCSGCSTCRSCTGWWRIEPVAHACCGPRVSPHGEIAVTQSSTDPTDPTEPRPRPRPSRRRGRRGAAYVEAVVIIPFFVIVWGLLNYVHQYYTRSLRHAAAVRRCAQRYTLGRCEAIPPGCPGATSTPEVHLASTLPAPYSGQVQALEGVPCFGNVAMNVNTWNRSSRLDETTLMNRPAVAGGGNVQLSNSQAMLCNESPPPNVNVAAEIIRPAFQECAPTLNQ